MDPVLEAILLEVFAALTDLVDERVRMAEVVRRSRQGQQQLASKVTSIDRRLVALERMVRH